MRKTNKIQEIGIDFSYKKNKIFNNHLLIERNLISHSSLDSIGIITFVPP